MKNLNTPKREVFLYNVYRELLKIENCVKENNLIETLNIYNNNRDCVGLEDTLTLLKKFDYNSDEKFLFRKILNIPGLEMYADIKINTEEVRTKKGILLPKTIITEKVTFEHISLSVVDSTKPSEENTFYSSSYQEFVDMNEKYINEYNTKQDLEKKQERSKKAEEFKKMLFEK